MATSYSIADLPRRITKKIKLAESGCWDWTAAKTPTGYGKLGVNYKVGYAHRIVYELLAGPIPEGLETDHLCKNRGCVNPAHIEPVTHQENLRRARKTVCVYGHPYTPENSRPIKNGKTCRECVRLYGLARNYGLDFSEVVKDQQNPRYARKYKSRFAETPSIKVNGV